MDTVYSLASGALAFALAGLAWLVAHSKQIQSVLNLIPTLVKDIEALKQKIDQHGQPQPSAPVAPASTTPPTA